MIAFAFVTLKPSIIRQALEKMPEGNEFHADVPDYYLPPKEDVHQYGVFNISL
jgi:hypothetical protein